MDKHVVSKKLAEQLVERGIVVKSHFKSNRGACLLTSGQWGWQQPDAIPRPLPCELMELLPPDFSVEKNEDGTYWCIPTVPMDSFGNLMHETREKSLADALAKMLIWLHDNGYLKEGMK